MKNWQVGDRCFFRNAGPLLLWSLQGIIVSRENQTLCVQAEDNRRYKISSILAYSSLEELEKNKDLFNPVRFRIGSKVVFVFKADANTQAIMLSGTVSCHKPNTLEVTVMEPVEMSGPWYVPPHRLREIKS